MHCRATLAVLLILLSPYVANAEYRAYLLAITNEQTGKSRNVISTLDHIQYPGYHHVNLGESVRIVDTWRCLKRSDHSTPICLNPNAGPNGTPGGGNPAQPAEPANSPSNSASPGESGAQT